MRYKFQPFYTLHKHIISLSATYEPTATAIGRWLCRWFIRFSVVQLYLTLVSLPVMIAWGLPTSLLSPLGNLIFAPFLTIFLGLSSLIFFLELLYLPHGLLDRILEQIAHAWAAGMAWDGLPVHYLCLATPPLWLFALLCACSIYLLVANPIRFSLRGLATIAGLFLLSVGLLKYHQKPHKASIHHIPCNRNKLTLIWDASTTVAIDPGALGSYESAPSWVQYTLLPEVIKKTGRTTIDYLIICKPTAHLEKAVATLLEHRAVTQILLPAELCPRRAIEPGNAPEDEPITQPCGEPMHLQLDGLTIACTPAQRPRTYREQSYRPLVCTIDSTTD